MEHGSRGNPGPVSGAGGGGHCINTTIKEGCHGNASHQFLEARETKPERETFKSINTAPALLKQTAPWQGGRDVRLRTRPTRERKRKRARGDVMEHRHNGDPRPCRSQRERRRQAAITKSRRALRAQATPPSVCFSLPSRKAWWRENESKSPHSRFDNRLRSGKRKWVRQPRNPPKSS